MWLLLVLIVDEEIANKLARAIAALIVDLETVTELREDVLKVQKSQALLHFLNLSAFAVLNLLPPLKDLLGPDLEHSFVVDRVFPRVGRVLFVREERHAIIVTRHLLELAIVRDDSI